MKIQKFDKSSADLIQKQLSKVGCELAKKYGIRLDSNNANHNDKEMSMVIRFRVPTKISQPIFAKRTELLDYPKIGQKFYSPKLKEEFEIVGYDMESSTFPLICQGLKTKKKMKFPLAAKVRIGTKPPKKGKKVIPELTKKGPGKPKTVKPEITAEWKELLHKGVKMKVLYVGQIMSHGKPYSKYKTSEGTFIHQIVKE